MLVFLVGPVYHFIKELGDEVDLATKKQNVNIRFIEGCLEACPQVKKIFYKSEQIYILLR